MDEVIDLYNTPLVVKGAIVKDVRMHVDRIEVTSYADSEPQYISGHKRIDLQISVNSAQAFKELAALLTGKNVKEIPEPEMVQASQRKVMLP